MTGVTSGVAPADDAVRCEKGRVKLRWRRWLPLGLLVTALTVVYMLDLHRLVSLETLEAHRGELNAWVDAQPLQTAIVYVLAYAGMVAVMIPGAVFMTIAGGFLFGIWLGGLLAAVGASIGAMAVYFVARTALGGRLVARSGSWTERMRAGFEENAWSYLFVLRLLPIFPFWLVNIVPALVGVPLTVYAIATVIGLLPGSFVYAGIGNGLGAVLDAGEEPNLGIMLEPAILGPFVALAVLALLPVAWKKLRARNKR